MTDKLTDTLLDQPHPEDGCVYRWKVTTEKDHRGRGVILSTLRRVKVEPAIDGAAFHVYAPGNDPSYRVADDRVGRVTLRALERVHVRGIEAARRILEAQGIASREEA